MNRGYYCGADFACFGALNAISNQADVANNVFLMLSIVVCSYRFIILGVSLVQLNNNCKLGQVRDCIRTRALAV
jgi:hypothetical protein